jgi:serine/threonine protein kinase/tetratricopeptide (TPR) repeat protein
MIGKTLSHYKVLEKIGEGGMGVVYKAEDTKLRRTVALKFLPPSAITGKDDRERFTQEAQAAAALDHANICTIYAIDEAEGRTFISMAYIEGVTLRQRIESGPLKLKEVLDIAIQSAEGLHVAHERKIVHRDIKPANIMLTERGQVKIMDFGLAKLAGGTLVTKQGTTLGTVAYMAPEQVGGDPADHRADIWSLGVVMYEMLTGLRPFRGDYDQAVIYSIINAEPEPVTALRSGVPIEFERIVTKALAKHAKHRYQNIDDVLVDLRRLKADLDTKDILSRTGMQLRPEKRTLRRWAIPSIAVVVIALVFAAFLVKFGQEEAIGAQIPIAVADFINNTDEVQLDGLSGMLITSLEQSRRLSVLTRSRMFDILRQMGKEGVDRIDEPIGREICRFADLNMLVVSSIRKFDDLYSIDLKVFDMSKNAHLFTAREEGRGRASIPSMIDKLAEKTRKGLKEKTVEIQAANARVADMTTPNLDAYQQYFLGEQYINQLKFDEAKEAFYKALELDSTFALAHYRLAYAHWWGQESEQIRRTQLDKALAYIDELPEKVRYLLRSQYAVYEKGYAEGIAILKEMERLYPDDKEMIYNLGDYSFHAHEFDEAAAYLEKVLDMDAHFGRALDHLTATYLAMEEFDKGEEMARRYMEETNSKGAYRLMSNARLAQGDKQGALSILKDGIDQFPDDVLLPFQIAMVYTAMDRFDEAEAIMDSLRGEEQPAMYRQFFQTGMQAVAMYQGRYRDALRISDALIEMMLASGDTGSASAMHLGKAFVYYFGWRDTGGVDREIENAMKHKRQWDAKAVAHHGSLWHNLATLYRMTGRMGLADSIAVAHMDQSGEKFWLHKFQSYAYKGDVERAEVYADSLMEAADGATKQLANYGIANMYFSAGRLEEAIEAIDACQSSVTLFGPRPIVYPMSYHLLGQIHEKRGDTKSAVASYKTLLDMWKDADSDLETLRDTRARLAALESTKP